MRSFISCGLLLLLLLISPAWGETPACRSQGGALDFPYPVQAPEGWDHDPFTTRGGDTVLIPGGAFVSAFTDPDRGDPASPYRGLPRWVAYEMRALLDGDGLPLHPTGARRPSHWYELARTAPLWREADHAGLDWSYRGFGRQWNRGHLAARAHANRLGWQDGCNSHVFVNALPEQARLNQGEWEALENYAAAAANSFGRVWTIAGPVFLPGRAVETIGAPGTVPLAVPHALFKLLVIETAAGIEARAFLFPQDASYHRCVSTPQEAYDLARYGVTLAHLEEMTGLRFLTRLSVEQRRRAEAGSATGPWPVPAQAYPQRCGGTVETALP